MSEKKRGCGYRVEGALYLVGFGIPVECDRLPYELSICSVCGAGVKFSRGFTWLDWFGFAGKHEGCRDKFICPLCDPREGDRFGLLWVGKKFYTPESFIKEAITIGVSKRIAQIPKDLKLGKTRILIAHPEAVTNICPISKTPVNKKDCHLCDLPDACTEENKFKKPGIIYSFVAQRVEQIVSKEQSEDDEYIKKLEKRRITPIVLEKEEDEKD